jgi:hypothetical protein
MEQQDITLAALRALNRRFIHNFVTNDVTAHDAILHGAFKCITTTGATVDRASYLRYWATGFDPAVIVYWDMRDEHITVIDDMALVRAVNRWTRRQGGDEVSGMTLYTDTYVRKDRRWLCVQAQLTAVDPANHPPDHTVVCRYVNGVEVAT